VLFKQATRDYAARHGYTATFMPRPATGDLGSSCHIHASLRTPEGTSIFHDPGAERQVSQSLLHAAGGTLTHAAEVMCWYAPTINSYRRTNSHDFAGNGLTWGFDNRTVTVRVLAGSPSAARLEFRLPGADVNPYLALAGLLASVNDGIRQRIDPGPPQAGDAYAMSANPALPATLIEAADAFSRSPFTATAFGKDIVSHYHALAQFEWNEFLRSVTDWERDRYLDVI
jgi:glutamine synthetase